MTDWMLIISVRGSGRLSALFVEIFKSPAPPSCPSLSSVFRLPSPCFSLVVLIFVHILPLLQDHRRNTNMPIIGSSHGTSTFITTVPACTTVVAEREEVTWSHSEVFVTSYGNLTAIPRLNVPDLTIVHTPDSSCIDRWVYLPTSNCGDDSSIDDIVWSVNPTRLPVSDPSYSRCQLYGTPTYSPGICPSGQTIAEVTAFESSISNGIKTFWQASCCKRYDATIAFFWEQR